ncbi:chymotrypsinogen B-like isoform X2 [Photinus pyralis]|uniref:chymotrypsinogen B-like isoform X2 n=1 Tax=Photinus pyralis TaxID=7054 RepID=UPI0012672196|nr:chymotrypsinogen B-like isoform X2 [Photinus pyralis]
MKCVQLYIFVIYVSISSSKFLEHRVLNIERNCGEQNGNIYPWVALIPLETRTYNPSAKVECIGTLISEQYVITSSSCLAFVVSKVQFWSNLELLEVEVERWVVYQATNLALLKLKKAVDSDFFSPICLPSDDLALIENIDPYTATWMQNSGLMRSSNSYRFTYHISDDTRIKKAVKTTIVNCQKRDNGLICLRPNGGDTICDRDEGSPIMFSDQNKWTLGGVLNYAYDIHESICVNSSSVTGSRITKDALKWIMHVIKKN